MKMSDGVEQAIHSVAMLAGLQSNGVLSAGALAEFHGVSTSYLLKHLQALSGAGLLIAQPGPTGGYRLARTPVGPGCAMSRPAPESACRCFRR